MAGKWRFYAATTAAAAAELSSTAPIHAVHAALQAIPRQSQALQLLLLLLVLPLAVRGLGHVDDLVVRQRPGVPGLAHPRRAVLRLLH